MRARHLHRQLAWLGGLAALVWASSGLLHPLMSQTAPRPAVQSPPVEIVHPAGLGSPGPMFAAAGIAQAELLSLAEVNGRRFWMARLRDRFVALDAETGRPSSRALHTRAIDLARHYAGEPASRVTRVATITAFDAEYPEINRLLPVQRVSFANGLAVYVDPVSARLGAVTDRPRRLLLGLFQHLHTLKWLEPAPWLRVGVISLLLGALLAMAGVGAMMLAQRGGRFRLNRWHRALGWAALPAVLLFATTGLLHLFVLANAPPPAMASMFDPRRLGPPPGETVSALAALPGPEATVWRAQAMDGRARYGSAEGASVAMDEADYARRLAKTSLAFQPMLLTTFTAEYGFANKRLPVLRVETEGGAVFVDVREGLIAGHAPPSNGLAAFEAWSFDTLHKFGWLASAGRATRDLASVIAALVVLAASAFGLAIRARWSFRNWRRRA